MKSNSINFTERALTVSGQTTFLCSGEVHYFRTPPHHWVKALRKAKKAGLNGICTYIPWNWHEIEPGRFDFSGDTDPRRNLIAFLDLCAELELLVHFRPGPTIISEWLHGGFPDWLLRDHPEILALDAANQLPDLNILYPPVTYLHPVFLEHVERWYHAFLPILQNHAATFMAVQIDNELMYGWGLRCGDPLFIDYNPFVVGTSHSTGFYQRWLSETYVEIDRLNKRYNTRWSDFGEVQPPRSLPQSLRELPWFLDWQHCKEEMANRYVEFLYDLLLRADVDLPLTMLSPYLTPYGVRRFADYFLERDKSILITTQCYPTLFGTGGFTEESAGHVAALMQLSRDWIAGSNKPLICNEAQGAMSFHLPPESMEAFYTLLLGQGLAGINIYMLAGGENPSGYGMNTGRSYDISAPMGPDGSERPHYPVIARLGKFLQTHGQRLLATDPLLDLAVGYYPPYETAALQGDSQTFGVRHHYGEILSQVFGLGTGAIARGSGVFSLLTAAGFNYAMLDLERTSLATLSQYRQLWCLGLDFMARDVQEKLVAYVENGGHLVMLPQAPDRDDAMQPCSILRELLAAPIVNPKLSIPAGSRRTPWHLVTIGEVRGLPISDIVDHYDLSPSSHQACAYDERSGKPCGYSVQQGNGKATLLGFKPRYGWDGHHVHRDFIHTIANWGKVEPHAIATDGDLVVIERAGESTGFLFVVNATRWPQSSKISYIDPETNERAVLPRFADGVTLPGQGGLILCLRTPIPGTNIEILYTTSQLQSWSVENDLVELILYGPRDTIGEIVLHIPANETVSFNGREPLNLIREGDTVTLTFLQTEDPGFLRISLS